LKRPPVIRTWSDAIIADNFAGGGGASSGIEAALGRSPDIAINHDPEAIAMHRANHPETRHFVENVWEVDPAKACGGKPVALAWFSPDCKHHSKAKGGKPREQKIRGLAWVAVRWAASVKPRVIALENVEEFKDWGPLAKDGHPIPSRKGQTFRAFVRKLERLGYDVEWRLLRACDYGAPTTRRRLFLVARCDGRRIVWPAPTHGPARPQPYRTAAECIDWSIECPSIFTRDRPLADKTLARIARGVRKFVLESARPFLLSVNHGGDSPGDRERRLHDVAKPLPTLTATGNQFALAVPYLVHRSNGERVGQAPRIYDIEAPLGTIVAQGQKHALVAAFLAKHYGERATGGWNGGSQADLPFGTVTVRDHHSLVAAHLVRYNGDRAGAERVADLEQPLRTLDTSNRFGLVASFLARYHGKGEAESLQLPLGGLTTRDRYALVTVTIDGEEYVIVDIGMRMLTPRELFRAQGFPDDYEIAPTWNGKPLTRTAQVRMCGNSVCPPIAAAVVKAQLEAA
jgi:DNA (cytosine-5)-methyltransferase 1